MPPLFPAWHTCTQATSAINARRGPLVARHATLKAHVVRGWASDQGDPSPRLLIGARRCSSLSVGRGADATESLLATLALHPGNLPDVHPPGWLANGPCASDDATHQVPSHAPVTTSGTLEASRGELRLAQVPPGKWRHDEAKGNVFILCLLLELTHDHRHASAWPSQGNVVPGLLVVQKFNGVTAQGFMERAAVCQVSWHLAGSCRSRSASSP